MFLDKNDCKIKVFLKDTTPSTGLSFIYAMHVCFCDRLDGGVSNNDFIAQLVADLTGLRVERPVHVEMSSLGCAHIVGYTIGKKQ